MKRIFFVHSFRALMPREMWKTASEPIKAVFETIKGKKIPKHKWERYFKALVGTFAIPAMVEIYMRARGFTTEKLGWKWKKEVVDEQTEEKRELIVSVNNILNQPLKWYHRFNQVDPTRPEGHVLQRIYNLLKWEVHPVYRTLLDVYENRPSMSGEQQYVYDSKAPVIQQIGQIFGYMMGNLFRHTEYLARGLNRGQLTKKEKEIEDRILKSSLTWYEQIMFGRDSPLGFGYAYVRGNKDEIGRIKLNIVNSEYAKSLRRLSKYIDGNEKEAARKWIDDWRKRCLEYIEKTYGISLGFDQSGLERFKRKVSGIAEPQDVNMGGLEKFKKKVLQK